MVPVLRQTGRVAACVLFAWIFGPSSGGAASSTWTGQNNTGNPKNRWTQRDNWAQGTPPTNQINDIFMQGTVRTTNTVDLPISINSLTISNSAVSFMIGGSLITNQTGIVSHHNAAVIISNNWALAGSQTWTSSSNSLNMLGNIDLGANTLTLSNNTATVSNLVAGAVSGTGGLTKVGDGNWILTGASANLFSGATTNAAGTLVLQKPEGTDAIAGNLVLTGGTLLLGASNQIADASAVTMTNATFRTGGYSDTVGVLTLEGDATIDMSGTSSTLRFDDSSGATWLAGNNLNILDYDSANDQIFFGTDDTGLTADQLNHLIFWDPDGVPGFAHGLMIDGNGRVTPSPIPEPPEIVSGILLVPLLLRRAWRRMMGAGQGNLNPGSHNSP